MFADPSSACEGEGTARDSKGCYPETARLDLGEGAGELKEIAGERSRV